MLTLPSWLPANRVAAIVSVLAALGALSAALAGVLPGGPAADAAVAIGALLAKAVVVAKYLDGAQKSEALGTKLTPSQPLFSQVGAARPHVDGEDIDRIADKVAERVKPTRHKPPAV